jgi:hypothetical protein
MLKAIGKFLFGCATTAFEAWTITMLWSWFVVAVFGLPALSIPAVLGLEMLVKTFMFNPYKNDLKDMDSTAAIIQHLVVSVVALIAGYVIHLCM